jgi:RNA polymerase sigma-70 factor (ECF subfamily)
MESMFPTSLTLLDRLRESNQPEAWERFVRLYTPLLLVWARRQGFQETDAEDVVQEVLVKLVRVLPEYQRGEGQSFRSWLFRLTVNQCRDFRRRKATRALPGAGGLSDVRDDSPVAELDEAEYRRLLVRRGMELIRADFGEATWTAFTRVMVEGRGVAEVAAELHITENAVFLARHRVLSRLRQELDGLLE